MVKIMIIRSQNRDFITFLENIQGIEIHEEIDKSARIVFEYVGKCKTMGRYRSYETALKVLDMLQKHYEEYETEKVYREGIYDINAFQMPEDSKVEE